MTMQSHLRTHVEDGIQQKVRLHNMMQNYKDQEYKTRERIIDETQLENQLKAQNAQASKLALVAERKAKDQAILEHTQDILVDTKQHLENVANQIGVHLEELSEIEIVSGGFVTHPIGVDKHATLDKENMVVKFKPEGHVEIPIAVRRSRWRDSSQLTIQKMKKAGV